MQFHDIETLGDTYKLTLRASKSSPTPEDILFRTKG